MQPPSEAPGPHLASDEDIQRARLYKVTPHNALITLAGYDPGWPVLFAREAARIRAALGGRAVQVEHVGSTSVPGLATKPIIDILLAVPDSSDEHTYVPALEAAGYVLRAREPDWFEHRLFKGPDTDINLHVFTVGAAEIDRMLAFRDQLRANAPTVTLTCKSSATWPSGPGGTCSTMPTPRAPSWNRSSRARPCTGAEAKAQHREHWPSALQTLGESRGRRHERVVQSASRR